MFKKNKKGQRVIQLPNLKKIKEKRKTTLFENPMPYMSLGSSYTNRTKKGMNDLDSLIMFCSIATILAGLVIGAFFNVALGAGITISVAILSGYYFG